MASFLRAAFHPLQTFGRVGDTGLMDDSVEQFHAYQRDLAEQGGPLGSLRRTATYWLSRLAIWASVSVVLFEALRVLPRNPDGSVKLAYYGPGLMFLALGSALLLRVSGFRKSPFSMTAWLLIALALIAIPAGAFDLFHVGR